ncbi:Protein of unknown function [Collimonas sp. OK242]|jgi:hypothetical protein|uniref:DUF1488 family protein n=1 Tax=Collimonas sp. OK242 TaxID=1798195 RepID=UPI00089C0659|nr:DUF1488 family protein [Collimonas sp. OK242]SDY55791.1 Protein of unknown function [Collimonas sp. OK242]
MQISFPASAVHDTNSGGIVIPVVVNDKLSKCKVSRECLNNTFYAGPHPDDRLATYRGHSVEIQTAIARKLRTLENCDDLILFSADFREKR